MILERNNLSTSTGSMAFVAVWMAWWWVTEAVSLYVTALLPLVLFPFLGIMPMTKVAPIYNNETVFLFIGGFMLAFAVERWQLHRTMALLIMQRAGATPNGMLIGVMASSYFLSMWMSNVATTMLLMPAVLAMQPNEPEKRTPLTTALLLGLAYASSIGGTATLVGTAPNMIFSGFYAEKIANGAPMGFLQWIIFALPVSFVLLVASFFILRIQFKHAFEQTETTTFDPIHELKKLGPLSTAQKRTLLVFASTVVLWIFRADLKLGAITLPGWANLLPNAIGVRDSTVAMLAALVLFLIPAGSQKGPLLQWADAKRLPLGIIFLFGGGFALADGLDSTGLSGIIASKLTFLGGLHPLVAIFALTTFMTFFTELTSNTASTYLMLPITLILANDIGAHPLMLMVPVVICASFAFMLPVATPPNAVIYGTGLFAQREMMRAGFFINLAAIATMTLAAYLCAGAVFGF